MTNGETPAAVCDVCTDARTRIRPCGTCDLRTCRGCARRCVLEWTRDAVCARCAVPWEAEECILRLGQTFWTREYRRCRQQRLLEDERARVPDAIPMAHRVRLRRDLRARVRVLIAAIRHGDWMHVPELRAANMQLWRLDVGADGDGDWGEDGRSEGNEWGAVRSTWVRCASCPPSGEGGSNRTGGGTLDASGWCATCARRTCRQCGQHADDPSTHVCDDAQVQSIAAIARECRPCARCRAPCARTDGCATMWCAHCHAFWNWDTGHLIQSERTPHNPDHREWMARTRALREVDDVPCGGIPDDARLHWCSWRLGHGQWGMALTFAAADCLRRTQRIRRRYPRSYDLANVNLSARLAYINDEIDENAFARLIERHERTCQFQQRVGQVLETLVLCGADVLQCLCDVDGRGDGDSLYFDIAAMRLAALRACVDAALAHVGQVYARAVPRLRPTWVWVLPRAPLRV